MQLIGSHRVAPAGRRKGKEIAGNKRRIAAIQLESAASDDEVRALIDEVKTGARAPLTPEEIEKVLGAHPAHLDQLLVAVRKAGLKVIDRSIADRMHGIVWVSGTYAKFKSFSEGLRLFHWHDLEGKAFIAREGALNVPAGLHIAGFYGLDERPFAHPNFVRHRPDAAKPSAIPHGATIRDLARMQGWNLEELDAAARLLIYISLGGDNVKIGKDLATMCRGANVNTPYFRRLSSDGTPNGDYEADETGENVMDLITLGLLNPNGAVIALQAANTDAAFVGAGEWANAYPGVRVKGKLLKPSGVSVSWAIAELESTPDSLERWHRVGQAGQLGGIDYFNSTGDDGPKSKTDLYTGEAPSVVPGIMGAAGIGVTVAGDKVTSISPWNDTKSGGGQTGYGISQHFPPEPYEARLNLPVSAVTRRPGHSASMFCDLAQPASAPFILYRGELFQEGGTSLSAPSLNAKLTGVKVAYGLPSILHLAEQHGEDMVDRITVGDDSAPYPASPDAVYTVMCGFGTPNHAKCKKVAAAAAALRH
jgi:hypothetical protein